MTFLPDKFKSIVAKIMKTKNSLDFFAVIKRFDADDKWDVILSADWIRQNNKQEDLIYIIELLKEEYSGKIDFISKILTFSPGEQFIVKIAEFVTENSIKEGYKGELIVSEDLWISEINIIKLDTDKYKNIRNTIIGKKEISAEAVF